MIRAGMPSVLEDVRPSQRVMNLVMLVACSMNQVGDLLGLDHSTCLVLATSSLSEDGIDLVNEDDTRLQFTCQGKDGVDELVRVAVPFFGQSRDV